MGFSTVVEQLKIRASTTINEKIRDRENLLLPVEISPPVAFRNDNMREKYPALLTVDIASDVMIAISDNYSCSQ